MEIERKLPLVDEETWVRVSADAEHFADEVGLVVDHTGPSVYFEKDDEEMIFEPDELTYLYNTILADPPWPEYGGGKIRRGADAHYPLMTVAQIKALPVKNIASPNSHLYLWVTNNYLPAGLEVMAEWGFKYKTCITWAKDRFGLGQYFRGQTEHILFGVRGVQPYKVDENGKRMQGTTLILSPRQQHSAKPKDAYVLCERVSRDPMLEMFARTTRPGWDAWGNQVGLLDTPAPLFDPELA